MYISDEDYARGIEFIQAKADSYLKQQSEYVDTVNSLQAESEIKCQQIIADFQSQLRLLHGKEALQVQQALLMAEGLMVIQNQLATLIRLLKELNETAVYTSITAGYTEINTNLTEENTSLIEQNTRMIERHTSKH